MPPLPTKKPPGESWTQEGFASAALPRWTNVFCFNENATKIWLLMIKWPFLLRGHVQVYVCDDDQRHLPQLVNKADESERWPTRKTFSLTRFETFSPTLENVFFPLKPLTWTADTRSRGRVGWQGSMSGTHIIFEPTPPFWLNPKHGIRIKHTNPQGTQ